MYVLGYSGFTRNSRIATGYRNPFAKTRQDFDAIFTFREGEVPFPMYPLGFFGHDAAAAIIRDGRIIACAAEERFNRSKYSLNLAGNTLLPQNAIRYCLQTAGISVDKIDYVAHYCNFNPSVIDQRLNLLKPFISSHDCEYVADAYQAVYRLMMDGSILLDQFERMLGKAPKNFIQVKHHQAHAASAYYPSGFNKSIILTLDGTGETESSLLAVGQDHQIHEYHQTFLPTSLGTLYLILTVYLGFKSLGDEYKVMGLAGYGKSQRYRKFFKSLITLKNYGSYTMDRLVCPEFKQFLVDSLGPARSAQDPLEQRHADIAAALQETLQETILHTLRYARYSLGIDRLCMAGGVALNSMMNGAIARSGLFKEIFVQPAAGDEGCSLGAALYTYYRAPSGNNFFSGQLQDVYLGPSFDDNEIAWALETNRSRVSWTKPHDLIKLAAAEIARGHIIGWFQGRMEFGPRALGNRSILADPRDPYMKDRLNARIKHREGFRPFAPAVIEEEAENYFDMGSLKNSPYMLFVVPVKYSKRGEIPAVTHVDGTARVQTVNRKSNLRFWKLLKEFKRITGLPVILNTSFNVMNEPIVCTPEDALRCFLSTDIDWLAIGDYLVKKRS
jgi:carbamoyltransferase